MRVISGLFGGGGRNGIIKFSNSPDDILSAQLPGAIGFKIFASFAGYEKLNVSGQQPEEWGKRPQCYPEQRLQKVRKAVFSMFAALWMQSVFLRAIT